MSQTDSFSFDLSEAELTAIAARRANAGAPTLGGRAHSVGTVLPAVLGAIQEKAAIRAAATIDEDVIAEALAAGQQEQPQPEGAEKST